MDMAVITALITGARFVKDSLEIALGYKIENETREKINEALKQVGTIQDTFFDLREEMFRLQTENQELRQQLKAQKDWENKKNQYQLEQTPRGALVYVFTGSPKHYACPSCFSKEIIHILQERPTMHGFFDCSNCKTSYVCG